VGELLRVAAGGVVGGWCAGQACKKLDANVFFVLWQLNGGAVAGEATLPRDLGVVPLRCGARCRRAGGGRSPVMRRFLGVA